MDTVRLLSHVARLQGIHTSTKKIANSLGSSQQTVSRLLIKLQEDGFLKRTITNRGMTIELQEKSFDMLRKVYLDLNSIFKEHQTIKGTVTEGLKEGQFYIKKYASKLKEVIGFKPYHGTLNLKVKKSMRKMLQLYIPLIVPEFTTPERSYGAVYCYPVKVKGVPGAIVVPVRTTHTDSIIEVVAPVNLRTELKLKEGQELLVSLQ